MPACVTPAIGPRAAVRARQPHRHAAPETALTLDVEPETPQTEAVFPETAQVGLVLVAREPKRTHFSVSSSVSAAIVSVVGNGTVILGSHELLKLIIQKPFTTQKQ